MSVSAVQSAEIRTVAESDAREEKGWRSLRCRDDRRNFGGWLSLGERREAAQKNANSDRQGGFHGCVPHVANSWMMNVSRHQPRIFILI
jgi:hypothetical protein